MCLRFDYSDVHCSFLFNSGSVPFYIHIIILYCCNTAHITFYHIFIFLLKLINLNIVACWSWYLVNCNMIFVVLSLVVVYVYVHCIIIKVLLMLIMAHTWCWIMWSCIEHKVAWWGWGWEWLSGWLFHWFRLKGCQTKWLTWHEERRLLPIRFAYTFCVYSYITLIVPHSMELLVL